MESTIGALAQLGPIGIALIILVVMWFLNRQTRASHEQQISYYRTEITRLNNDHDEELSELRTEIKGLRDEIRELRAEMESERQARRVAEERLHRFKMGGSE